MKKNLSLSAFFVFFIFYSHAQIRFNGLPNNAALIEEYKHAEFRKNNDLITLHTFVDGEILLCSEILTDEEVLNFQAELLDAETLGSLVLNDSCLTYRAGSEKGRDTLSIELTLEEGSLDFQRVIEVRELSAIPWMDDFSYVDMAKGRPHQDNWLDKDVYVNDHLAYHPPSYGVASFDGLNEYGTPYGTGWGSSDTLTSTFFDLSNYDTSDQVYLSFVYQPMGLTISPEERDRFILEFKDEDGVWKVLFSDATQEMDINNPQNPFYWEIKLTEPKFFYSGFQFRFRNYNPKSGFVNLWHLDYVRLIPEFNPTDFTLINDDIALGHAPYGIFRNHTAIPIKQFLEDPESMVAEFLRVDVINHFDEEQSADDAKFSIEEVLSGQNLVENGVLLEGDVNNALIKNLPPFEFKELDSEFSMDVRNEFIDKVTNLLRDKKEAVLSTQYRLNNTGEDETNFPSLLQNGMASFENYLTGYYAYDDGSAEVNLELSGGFTIAVRYEMKVSDTLDGIMIYLPFIDQDLSSSNFGIEIKRNLNDNDALYSDGFARVEQGNIYDIPNFSYYKISNDLGDGKEGLVLEQGEFYVILRSQQGLLNLGYDRQMDARENQFLRLNTNEWVSFTDPAIGAPPGTVMCRPIFKDFTRLVLSQNEPNYDSKTYVFPNPAKDQLMVAPALIGSTFQIVDFMGRAQMKGVVESSGRIDVSRLENGAYIIEFNDRALSRAVRWIKGE